MPKADFFARFGLFVTREFIDQKTCSEIIRDAPSYDWRPMDVFRINDGNVINDDSRKTLTTELPEPFGTNVKNQLQALKPALESYYHQALSGFEDPQFFRYTEGCYFRSHADVLEHPSAPKWLLRRQLTVSINLNTEEEDPEGGSYSGGSLVFYGLMRDPRAQCRGFPLTGEPGLLIGYPSRMVHEVLPVTRGERYSIATCFYS